MTLDGQTTTIIVAFISAIGLLFNAIIHWEKLRPALFSHSAFVIAEYALIFGCYFLGRWAVIVGANVYLVLVFMDFVRTGDNGCGAIGSAILAAATGVFCFATQFALIVNGK